MLPLIHHKNLPSFLLVLRMEQMTFSKLMLLFLSFSYLLLLHPHPSAAVPTSRSHLMQNKEDSSSVQDLFSQEAMDVTEELLGEGEGLIEGRMLKITTDYGGTGANKNHDPKPPARA